MLDTLITSKTRIKLLLKFFLNKNATAYLRNLSGEFGESSNAIRLELNKFEKAGLLKAYSEGNKKIYQAESTHPLFHDLHNLLCKFVGLDQIIDKVVRKLGGLEAAFVTGDIAKGKESDIIDLVLVGDAIDRTYLNKLIEKAEQLIHRRIRFLIYTGEEIDAFIRQHGEGSVLLLWKTD